MSHQIFTQTALVIRVALSETEDTGQRAAIAGIARNLADAFKSDNAAFRYDKFFAACGLDMFGELLPNRVNH